VRVSSRQIISPTMSSLRERNVTAADSDSVATPSSSSGNKKRVDDDDDAPKVNKFANAFRRDVQWEKVNYT
jgi:hypothetical protein